MTRETDCKPRITHIALKVSDIKRAAAFYRDVFGFQQTDLRRDGDHVSCHLTDGTIDLGLVEFDPGSVIGGASSQDSDASRDLPTIVATTLVDHGVCVSR